MRVNADITEVLPEALQERFCTLKDTNVRWKCQCNIIQPKNYLPCTGKDQHWTDCQSSTWRQIHLGYGLTLPTTLQKVKQDTSRVCQCTDRGWMVLSLYSDVSNRCQKAIEMDNLHSDGFSKREGQDEHGKGGLLSCRFLQSGHLPRWSWELHHISFTITVWAQTVIAYLQPLDGSSWCLDHKDHKIHCCNCKEQPPP